MNYAVTIKENSSKKDVLIINEHLAEKLKLKRKKRGYVAFGTQKNYVDIIIKKGVAENEVVLSKGVIENLHLPLYPIFEIKVKGNEICLGPCIGILASQKAEEISKRRLTEITLNTLDYKRIQGAIIAFALDKVDKENRLIDGYCYNPEKDSWEPGIFPYPLAVFRRSGLSDEWQNHFLSVIGDTVFSNHSFDKWEMHKWFSNEVDIAPNLPDTVVYKSKQDIIDMLKKYEILYIKPISGMKGFGVVRVRFEKGKIIFGYREDDKNIEKTAEGESELQEVVDKLFEPNDYIIQQGLELINHDGGVVDFRCVMQKNEACKWICNGIIARVGAKESVVSNISSGGAALPAMDLIREALEASETEAFEIKERIMSLCIRVCRTLDEYGFNFGMLGLDIGLDKDKNTWLIEVNNRRPHPAIALRASDIASYYTILAGPLHYAKALAGFGSEGEKNNVL